jgi:hypothetical protein
MQKEMVVGILVSMSTILFIVTMYFFMGLLCAHYLDKGKFAPMVFVGAGGTVLCGIGGVVLYFLPAF